MPLSPCGLLGCPVFGCVAGAVQKMISPRGAKLRQVAVVRVVYDVRQSTSTLVVGGMCTPGSTVRLRGPKVMVGGRGNHVIECIIELGGRILTTSPRSHSWSWRIRGGSTSPLGSDITDDRRYGSPFIIIIMTLSTWYLYQIQPRSDQSSLSFPIRTNSRSECITGLDLFRKTAWADKLIIIVRHLFPEPP
jgi:hypothetical protein